jgi:hypothetical protein
MESIQRLALDGMPLAALVQQGPRSWGRLGLWPHKWHQLSNRHDTRRDKNHLACFSKHTFLCQRMSPRLTILTTCKSLTNSFHWPPCHLHRPSLWLGQHTVFITPTFFRLNHETMRTSYSLHVYSVDCSWTHPTSQSPRLKSPTWSRSSHRWPPSRLHWPTNYETINTSFPYPNFSTPSATTVSHKHIHAQAYAILKNHISNSTPK